MEYKSLLGDETDIFNTSETALHISSLFYLFEVLGLAMLIMQPFNSFQISFQLCTNSLIYLREILLGI